MNIVAKELTVLSAFLAVADERSFARAPKGLKTSTSGLRHCDWSAGGKDLGVFDDREAYQPDTFERPASCLERL